MPTSKIQFQMAPDTGSIPIRAPLDLLPQVDDVDGGEFQDVSAQDDDIEYVTEGSEGIQPQPDDTAPEDLRGKSREEILAALMAERAKLQQQQQSAEPVTALTSTMSQLLARMEPPKVPIQPGYSVVPQQPQRMSDADFEKYINDLSLENPFRAQQEMARRNLEPILQTFAVNQSQLSRELVLTNPETRKVYDKYGAEVETYVAQVPVDRRLTNPRVYQEAIEAVKARHMDEFLSESLQTKMQEMEAQILAKYGIDPAKPPQAAPRPASYTAPPQAQRPAQAPKKQVVIPRWVAEEADKRGMEPGFYFEHLKSQGRIK